MAKTEKSPALARLDEILCGRRARLTASDIGAPWCDDAVSHQNPGAMRAEGEPAPSPDQKGSEQ